ncbi:MAG: VCBS repeat-containing protein [Anaerolineae bacterium]|nr:VCBS repeat-containing protein [Anaerolineae bacterium]
MDHCVVLWDLRIVLRRAGRSALLLIGLMLLTGQPPARAWEGDMQVVRTFPELAGEYWAAEVRDADWADWDNDGDLDLAVVQYRYARSVVFENEGGALSMAWQSPVPANYNYSGDWGDFDDDDLPDLAIGGTTVALYRNTGGGLVATWSAGASLVGTQVAWGDLNGDGYDDLAVGAENSPLRIYTSDGVTLALTWTAPVTTTIRALGWADVDGDLDPDLAVGSVEGLRIYTNESGVLSGIWDAPDVADVSALAWADWDSDGDLDLALGIRPSYGDGALVLLTNASGSLAPAWSALEANLPYDLDWGDWNGDGRPDLAVGNGTANGQHLRIRVYESRPGGLALGWSSDLTEIIYLGMAVAWGDFDRDDDADLFVGTYTGSYPSVLLGNHDGRLEVGWTAQTNYDAYAVAWGDLDGDADLDLALGTQDEGLQIWASEDGALSLDWSASEADDVRALAWGDVDNDGDLDLAVGPEAGPVRLYVNEGGALSLSWSSPAPETVASLAWADVDRDGDLDLATGGAGRPVRLYTNVGGALSLAWSATGSEVTTSLAWADVDGDNDLDLAVGNDGSPVRVYRNTGGTLALGWSAAVSETTTSLAWGDWDDDGDPDLAVGNYGEPLRIYANTGGVPASAWTSPDADHVTALQWADWDGDGDLDLAVGAFSEPNKVYANLGGSLIPLWAAESAGGTRAIAWGDCDNDGDLDLAAAHHAFQPLTVYANQSRFTVAWSSLEQMHVSAQAWGDMDADGDLDLAVSVRVLNQNSPEIRYGYNRVYRRTTQGFEPAWTSPEHDDNTAVAWADHDGDGDLDISFSALRYMDEVGTLQGGYTRLYRNDGTGAFSLVWTSPQPTRSSDLAWADVDQDGDLDLATQGGYDGQDNPDRLYLNDDGVLTQVWEYNQPGYDTGLAWGDYDGDGYPDLISAIHLYPNVNGQLGAPVVQSFASRARGVAWRDWDGDGDLDLGIAYQSGKTPTIFTNDSGVFTEAWSFAAATNLYYSKGLAFADWNLDGYADAGVLHGNEYGMQELWVYSGFGQAPQAAWITPDYDREQALARGDYDGDGDADLATGGEMGSYFLGGQNHNAPGAVRIYENHANDAQVMIDTAPRVAVRTPGGGSAPDAGGSFAAAVVLQGPEIEIEYVLTDPESDPVRTIRAWFSLDGGSTWQPAVAAGGTITGNLAAAPEGVTHTFTWDLFGSGVTGSSDTTVFRIDAVQGYRGPGPFQYAYRWAASNPFRVRGAQVRVVRGGQPVAGAWVLRLPAGVTGDYELYRDLTGEPLITGDGGYLLGNTPMAIGDHLVALAPVTGTHGYTLYYSNAAPTQTGVDPYTVTQTGVQVLETSADNPVLLYNLDVSLEWDARYDEQLLSRLQYDFRRTSELLFDWSNGQMALGSVTIYHARQMWADAHIQIYASNRMRPNAAQGGITNEDVDDPSVEGVVYQPGQVRMGAVWNRFGDPSGNLGEDWARALAHELGHYAAYLDDNYMGFNVLGQLVPVTTCPGAMTDPYRDDYSEFHPLTDWLAECAGTLSHQTTGRADWQTITTFYPWLDGATTNSGPSGLPLAVTQVDFVSPPAADASLPIPLFYLSQHGHSLQPGGSARAFLFLAGGDTVIDLGRPSLDQVLARGAAPGDRLCVFEPGQDRLGCEVVQAGDEQLALYTLASGLPRVDLEALDEQHIGVSVGLLEDGLVVRVRLYPADGGTPAEGVLSRVGDVYTGVLVPAEPAPKATVHVWVEETAPAREIVTDYVLGGNPAYVRGRMAYVRGRMAPAVSSDGQVILFGNDLTFPDGEFYSLQALSSAEDTPPWTTPIGQVYRLLASASAPSLIGTSISFSYLGSEVPPGEESWLKIYYNDESVPGNWQPLETTRDMDYNHAVADAQGPGLYVLMSSLEIPLYRAGWNLFSYPVQATRPISDALISISGIYTTVYGYDGQDLLDPWKMYDVSVPGWVNDLHTIEFVHAYWIQTTRAITLSLLGVVETLSLPLNLFEPPATFYGAVLAGEGFTPAPGMAVKAWIDGHLCGLGQTVSVAEQVVYSVNVMADGEEADGCGAPGRPVTFQVDGLNMAPSGSWTNLQVQELDISPAVVQETYALTVDLIGSGTVTREPDQNRYPFGQVVTLTAVPALGWSFAGWGGDLSGSDNPAALTITGASIVTATFAQESYALTIDVVGNGTVTREPDQSLYPYGRVVTLTAVPALGWGFAGWSGALSGTGNPAAVTIVDNSAVTATFTQQESYALTVDVVGSGAVTREPDQLGYLAGSAVTLTAVPAPGWSFASWSGNLSGSDNPAVLMITEASIVTATFAQESYALTVDVVGDGAVTREPDQPGYLAGSAVTLTAVPAPGWSFVGWSGALSSTAGVLEVVIRSDVQLTATFITYRVHLPLVSSPGATRILGDQRVSQLGAISQGAAAPKGWTR